jgi:hypothetical protein
MLTISVGHGVKCPMERGCHSFTDIGFLNQIAYRFGDHETDPGWFLPIQSFFESPPSWRSHFPQ